MKVTALPFKVSVTPDPDTIAHGRFRYCMEWFLAWGNNPKRARWIKIPKSLTVVELTVAVAETENKKVNAVLSHECSGENKTE